MVMRTVKVRTWRVALPVVLGVPSAHLSRVMPMPQLRQMGAQHGRSAVLPVFAMMWTNMSVGVRTLESESVSRRVRRERERERVRVACSDGVRWGRRGSLAA